MDLFARPPKASAALCEVLATCLGEAHQGTIEALLGLDGQVNATEIGEALRAALRHEFTRRAKILRWTYEALPLHGWPLILDLPRHYYAGLATEPAKLYSDLHWAESELIGHFRLLDRTILSGKGRPVVASYARTARAPMDAAPGAFDAESSPAPTRFAP